MCLRNTKSSYGQMTKYLHLVTMVLVLALLLVGTIMGYVPIKPLRYSIYTIHKLVGLGVLIIMVFFAIWTLFNPKPAYPENMSQWQVWLAKFVRIGFYITLIAMPLFGWIMATAKGGPPSLFGIASFPMPGIPLNKSLGHFFNEAHEITAWIIACLVVLHVAGAFVHHVIYRDNVVRRMMRLSSDSEEA